MLNARLILLLLLLPLALAAAPPPTHAPSLPPLVTIGTSAAPQALFNLDVPTEGATDEARARHFLTANKHLVGAIAVDELTVAAVTRTHRKRVVAFQLTAGGLPIEHRTLAVSMDLDGRVKRVMSDWTPVSLPLQQGDIGADEAAAIASDHFDGAPTGWTVKMVLAASSQHAVVVYRVVVARILFAEHYFVYVSAEDGRVLSHRAAMKDMIRWEVPR